VGNLLSPWPSFIFALKEQFYPLGYKQKALMDWQYLRQGRGQDVQSFTKEFRKQALNLGIALDLPEVITKYIGSLRRYIRHSLLLFEPTTIDSASVKAIHLENRETPEWYDHPKRAEQPRKWEKNPLVHIVRKRGMMKKIVGSFTLS